MSHVKPRLPGLLRCTERVRAWHHISQNNTHSIEGFSMATMPAEKQTWVACVVLVLNEQVSCGCMPMYAYELSRMVPCASSKSSSTATVLHRTAAHGGSHRRADTNKSHAFYRHAAGIFCPTGRRRQVGWGGCHRWHGSPSSRTRDSDDKWNGGEARHLGVRVLLRRNGHEEFGETERQLKAPVGGSV